MRIACGDWHRLEAAVPLLYGVPLWMTFPAINTLSKINESFEYSACFYFRATLTIVNFGQRACMNFPSMSVHGAVL